MNVIVTSLSLPFNVVVYSGDNGDTVATVINVASFPYFTRNGVNKGGGFSRK